MPIEEIGVDAKLRRLTIPHLGITMRVLMNNAYHNSKVGTRPTWKIVYQHTVIGEIRLKTVGEKNEQT